MSVSPQLLEFLQLSALIFFNIFCVLGIVTSIFVLITINSLKNKLGEVGEKVSDSVHQIKESTLNMNEMGFNIFSLVSPFIFGSRRKNGFASLIKKFFDK